MISYIRHENDLINQRITWFVTIQAVVFAGLGFLVNGSAQKLLSWVVGSQAFGTEAFAALISWFVVSSIGLVASVSGRDTVDAALEAQKTIDVLWCAAVEDEQRHRLPDMVGGKGKYNSRIGGAFARIMPVLCERVH